MQHLRSVGIREDGIDSILIEAPALKNSKGRSKSDPLFIPKEALPSASELPRNYESQQAIPQSIAGLQPDMDPHLRQALEALEDDAFVDGDLDETFFDELVEGGERGSDKDVQFEFEENGIEDEMDASLGQGTGIENESEKIDWESKFALFKKNRVGLSQESASDDESLEGNDTIGSLPSISVIGGKGKRRRMGSDASGYSMSSSSMYRNQALQILDERFDQVCLHILTSSCSLVQLRPFRSWENNTTRKMKNPPSPTTTKHRSSLHRVKISARWLTNFSTTMRF